LRIIWSAGIKEPAQQAQGFLGKTNRQGKEQNNPAGKGCKRGKTCKEARLSASLFTLGAAHLATAKK
jgi:hypothetical protein